LTEEIVSVLSHFSCLFTYPTWKNIQTLFTGAILCRGPRQITKILRSLGLSQEKNFSRYHNVLSRAKWNGLTASKILFGLLLSFLPKDFPILIVVDETLERRRGKKIKAKGMYRDAVRSSQSNIVKSMGLSWQCMTLILPLPYCHRPWALPFLTILAPSEKCNQAAGKVHKTSIDWTRQMVSLVCRWLKHKPWILIGDGAYAKVSLIKHCLKHHMHLISRIRYDAALHHYPEYKPKQRGRPKQVGNRIHLKKLYDDPKQQWEQLEVDWYGGGKKLVSYFQVSCLWYLSGRAPIPLNIIVLRKTENVKDIVVLFSTSKEHTPKQIINWFILRWNIEVTFEEVRAHLGVETQRQWSDKAIERTTPLLMALYSIITIIGCKLSQANKIISSEITSWYQKNNNITFSDLLVLLRKQIWFAKIFKNSPKNNEVYYLSENNINNLIYQLSLSG